MRGLAVAIGIAMMGIGAYLGQESPTSTEPFVVLALGFFILVFGLAAHTRRGETKE